MLTREQLLRKIYTKTHRDFKGKIEGRKMILVYRSGTCLVALDDLTDREMYDKLPEDLRAEAFPNGRPANDA